MTLQDKKIMPPPWLAHREIERYSIGWRMGYGEETIYRFGNWLDTLSPEERAEYRSLFPEPVTWKGWWDDELRLWAARYGALTRRCGTDSNTPLCSVETGVNSARTVTCGSFSSPPATGYWWRPAPMITSGVSALRPVPRRPRIR